MITAKVSGARTPKAIDQTSYFVANLLHSTFPFVSLHCRAALYFQLNCIKLRDREAFCNCLTGFLSWILRLRLMMTKTFERLLKVAPSRWPVKLRIHWIRNWTTVDERRRDTCTTVDGRRGGMTLVLQLMRGEEAWHLPVDDDLPSCRVQAATSSMLNIVAFGFRKLSELRFEWPLTAVGSISILSPEIPRRSQR